MSSSHEGSHGPVDGSIRDSDKPSAFRALLPAFATQQQLPRAFVKKHIPPVEDEESRSATLLGPDGKTWNVSLHKSQQDTYLSGEKWHACVQSLNLKVGYFLVFSYDGKMLFNFKVFDLSACETTYHQIPLSTNTRATKKFKTCKDGHNFRIVSQNRGQIASYCKDCKCTRSEACLSPTNFSGNYMELPFQFWKRAKISKEQDMLTLVDPKGRYWLVKLFHIRYRGRKGVLRTRVCMRKGFDKFIINNQLELGDTCIFELESGEKNKMQVKIRKA